MTDENNIIDDLQPKKLDVIHWPDKRLNVVADEVTDFDDNLRELIIDMFFTMKNLGGVGLAAPQVGVSKRVIVLNVSEPLVLINPVLIAIAGEFEFEEGCLSVPGYFESRTRPNNIQLGYQTDDGERLQLTATGLTAFAIQHEIDHLDGKVFVDDLSFFKKSRVKNKISKTLKNRARLPEEISGDAGE